MGSMTLAVTIGDASPALLDLLDIQGRRLSSHRISSGPGRFEVNLGERVAVPSGIYFARVTQGNRKRMVRVTLLK